METIYFPDNIHPVIKLERLADSDTELEDSKPAIQRTKMGEIYQRTRDHLTFVCTHCSDEFTLFIQFTSHIEEHLQALFSDKLEPATDATTVYPIDDSLNMAVIQNDKETEKNELFAITAHWNETISNRNESSNEDDLIEPTDDDFKLKIIDQCQLEAKERNFDCPQCNGHFKNSGGLKNHLTRKHSHEKFQCMSCNKSYTAKDTFRRHVKVCQIHNDEQRQSNCEISNGSEQRDISDSAKSFECFQCHKPILTQIECEIHVENHLKVDTNCKHCARTIQTTSSLRLHRRYCKPPTVQDAPTECPVCCQKFPSYGQYFVHAREDHRLTGSQMKQKKRTKCGRCSVEFDTRLEYEKHLESHKSQHHIKEHTCKLCGKIYQTHQMYTRHMQRHEGKGLFKCEICQNTYATQYRKFHMRNHTGEKKFQCNECGALWASMSQLTKHLITHTNDRPHQCEFCQKRYRKAYLLQEHRRLHTGEYIHYCKTCKKGYTLKTSLQKHNLKVHGILKNGDKILAN